MKKTQAAQKVQEDPKLNRRRFVGNGAIGLGLLSAGGLAGWLSSRSNRSPVPEKTNRRALDPRFTYDVSRFAHTDPALLRYSESASIPTGFADPSCLAVGADDLIFLGGDKAVKALSPEGELRFTVSLAERPQAIMPTADGQLLVALPDHLEVYDHSGRQLLRGESLGARVFLTSVAAGGGHIFAADAGNREVIRCDANGRVLARFGRVGAKDGTPGFVVPSPYFDLYYGADGLLWVANPGRHRLEAYTPEGQFELSWGSTSMAVEGFCGCCNPVHFTRLADGRFVTSEKGLNRIKLHDVKGNFTGVVAGPETLVKDLELARQACANCHIGFGFDVACDSQDRVLALDPATKTIRVFTPKPTAA
jgi:hypothetical protein